LLTLLIRGRIRPEEKHPVTRLLQRLYSRPLRVALEHPGYAVVVVAVGLTATVVPGFQRIGSEFMPPLYEGTLLYMPVTQPGLSMTEAGKLLQQMDQKLKSFPEVERVFGKAGRAETSTDSAPFSMMEVVVELKSPELWRTGITYESLIDQMDKALQFPGVANAWTMPIKARIDMLTTGVRTPVGIKIFGPDLKVIESIGQEIEMAASPGARYPQRVRRESGRRLLPGLSSSSGMSSHATG
jgi:Cu(I)/Ag(I) efflux system membrane protein CusA/SilA